jgi:hypothetical protein
MYLEAGRSVVPAILAFAGTTADYVRRRPIAFRGGVQKLRACCSPKCFCILGKGN